MKRFDQSILRRASVVLMPLVVVLVALEACRSEDLGDKKPDVVTLRGEQVGWSDGISTIIARKCATCHTAERSQFVPANTPHSIDGMSQEHFYQEPANRGKVAAMRHRLVDTPKQPMPPPFATPLSDKEKAALSEYFEQAVARLTPKKPDPKPTVDPEGEEREGEGSGSGGEVEEPRCQILEPTKAEVEEILDIYCAGCHTSPPESPRKPALVHYEEWLKVRELARAKITEKDEDMRMPPGDPEFMTSDDGLKLLGQYKECQ